MQQLVIKNDKVMAVHLPDQDLRGKYPGAEIVLCKALGVDPGDYDPRTREEKRNDYADKRRMEYPSIAEQLDMMYWDVVSGKTDWTDTIGAIKRKYPKPETENEQE